MQPLENITYQENSSTRFKIIKRHETELKWINFLQKTFDNNCHGGNISKTADFDVFPLLEFRKRKSRSHGLRHEGK